MFQWTEWLHESWHFMGMGPGDHMGMKEWGLGGAGLHNDNFYQSSNCSLRVV